MKTQNNKQGREKKKHKNVFAVLFITIFLSGYTLFFTSKIWMPTTGDAERLTRLNEDIQWENRTIKIIRWEYSENQQRMEVELDLSDRSFEGLEGYDHPAMETNAGMLPVTPVLEDMDWIILQIDDVPKRFSEISLRIQEKDAGEESGTMIRMYTNINDVDRVETLERKDRAEYLVEKYQLQVQGYQEEIKKINKRISESEKRIRNIEAEILQLQEKETYQTEKQIQETESVIEDAKNEILSEEEHIANDQAEAAEVKERIRNTRDQIRNLKEQTEKKAQKSKN